MAVRGPAGAARGRGRLRGSRRLAGALRDEGGQMTIELLVVLPVILIVAVIAVNALTFFGDCAAFDRVARNAVRICAASPGYGQDVGQSAAQVETMVGEALARDNLEVSAEASGGALGQVTFTVRLSYAPTLFGLGLRDEVLGVALPRLEHRVALTVDPYKPGMLF